MAFPGFLIARLTPGWLARFGIRQALLNAGGALLGGEGARVDFRALMPSLHIEIKADELERLLAGLDDPKVARSIRRGAVRVAATIAARHARQIAPYRTGTLQRSIRVRTRVRGDEVQGLAIAGVASWYRGGGSSASGRALRRGDAYYAAWVEQGTRPHVIRAGDARALAIGGRALRQGVRHPGAKPTLYMQRAADKSAPLIGIAMDDYVQRRIAQLERSGA